MANDNLKEALRLLSMAHARIWLLCDPTGRKGDAEQDPASRELLAEIRAMLADNGENVWEDLEGKGE